MKKLLALLLALLLPVCALAETYECTLAMDADDATFAQFAKAILTKIPGMNADHAERYAKALHTLLQDTKVSVVSQSDAASFSVELAGGSLFDVTVCEDAKATYMTSSLLPGYALVEEHTPAQKLPSMQTLIDDAVMQNVLASMDAALSAWLSEIEPTMTHGVFHGDAYEGGTQCITWALTDQDIAALVSALATDELCALVTKAFTMMELDAAQLLKEFDELNDRVADEDAYFYILRLVRDDEQQPVGLSLSIMEETAQVATVSFGVTEKTLTLVVGLGMNGQNYWWECTLQGNRRDEMLFLDGVSREWIADKASAFGYVRDTNAPVSVQYWNCSLTQSGQRLLWDASLYQGETADPARKLGASKGSVNPDGGTFEASFTLNAGTDVPLKIVFSGKPVDAISPLDSALKLCSTTAAADAELYKELNKTLSLELSARMVKLLPLDVIMTLSELFTVN